MSLLPDQVKELDKEISDAEFCKQFGIPSIKQQQRDADALKFNHLDICTEWPFGKPASPDNPY